MKCDKESNSINKYQHIYYKYDLQQYSYSLVYQYVLDYMLLWKLAYIDYLKANFEGG